MLAVRGGGGRAAAGLVGCTAEWRFLVTWIAALWCGATSAQLDELHAAVEPIITQLMGRHALYAWTLAALQTASSGNAPQPYAAFVRDWAQDPKKLDISKPSRAHTAVFLKTLAAATPYPPQAYFNKMEIGCGTC